LADTVSKKKRSEIMSKIRGKDTKPELMVRQYLYHNGFRYRKHYRKIPGSPDVYLSKYNTAIFINGCFWHGHENCKYYKTPKSNTSFWLDKINKNKARDIKNKNDLQNMGIQVIIIWECELKSDFNKTMQSLVEALYKNIQ